ncbi:MAG: DUF6069 family protein [Bacteroidetes bacterium]|nr:DUF6069 family protein [Bacteroidota bacterium]
MSSKVSFKKSIIAGLMAAGLATVVNAILFFVLHAAGVFVDTIFLQPNQPLTVLPVIISSVMPSIVASIVFFLLEKYTNNGFKIFKIVALVLGVISLVNPFMGIEGVTTAFAIGLDVMHVVVILSLLFFIGKAVKNNA